MLLRFLVNVASQLTCYLLQLVYAIICTSIAAAQNTSLATSKGLLKNEHAGTTTDTIDGGAPVAAKTNASDSIAFVSDVFVNNHDLINYKVAIGDDGQKIPGQRSDITTIVALREFLIHGIGGRILEVLLKVDTKVRRKKLHHNLAVFCLSVLHLCLLRAQTKLLKRL